MSKGIIEKTQRISSKMTTFIWFLGMCNFFKMDKYCETEGVIKFLWKKIIKLNGTSLKN
jgi:hypothetical protein